MLPSFSIDLNAAKSVRLGPIKLGLTCVVTNLLDAKTSQWVYGATGEPDDDGYVWTLSPANWPGPSYVTLVNTAYNPRRDMNHDGYISAEEEYVAYRVGYLDYVDNPINYGPPRQVKLGVNLEF